MRFVKKIVALSVVTVMSTTTVFAAPEITSAPKTIKAYVGDTVELDYGFNYDGFTSEKMCIDVKDFFGTQVLYNEEQFSQKHMISGKYSYKLDTSKWSEGVYNIESHIEWVTFYQWHRDFGAKNTKLELKTKPEHVVTITKAENVKAKKIKVTWKKVAGATKYQVKIGKGRYSTTKCKYVKKKLRKGKTYTVNVRAYVDGKWRKWTFNKKVKVTK